MLTQTCGRVSRVHALPLLIVILCLGLLACDPKAEPTVATTPSAPAVDPFNPPPPPDEPPVDPNAPDPAEPLPPEDEDPNAPIDPADPLAGMDEDAPTAAGAPTTALPALTGDCVLRGAPKRVWPHRSIAAITATSQAFVVAGYETKDAREQIFVLRVAATGLAQPLVSLPLPHAAKQARVAGPALTTNVDGSVTVVAIDGHGAITARRVATDHPNGAGTITALGEGGDLRFSPAVTAYGQRTLVAWTDGRATPMRVWTTRIEPNGTVSAPVNLTQTSMGAAAPTFIDGSNPPELLFVDPRAALSTLVRVAFKPDASAGEAHVVVPLNSVRQPPQLAAARGGNRTWAAFTAMGTAATTAVGLLSIDPVPTTPEALVPGTAYGSLSVAAVATADAAVFAADTPTAPGRDTPRRVHVTRVTDQGRGQPTSIEAGGGGANHAAIARAADGTVAVSFDNDSGVYVAFLRCDSTP